MINRICPICGSNEIIENIKPLIIKEQFGGEKSIDTIENYCPRCESGGDFFNQNDMIINNTIIELKHECVSNILNYFKANKISVASIERALNIPQQTFMNLNGESLSIGVSLLKYLRLFPWLIEVAENKYDPIKANDLSIEGIQQ